jgi:hypothetical protein
VKRLKSRRLWLVLAVLVGLILVGRWLDRSQPIEGYRLVDDRTIGVEVDASSPQWTRITGVTETFDRVTVSVGSFIFPWPQQEAGVGTSEELLVTLSQPLGSRSVIDGNTGDTVERVQCALGRCAASGRTARPAASLQPGPATPPDAATYSGCAGSVPDSTSACQTLQMSGPPGGLSRAAAIAAAIQLVPAICYTPPAMRSIPRPGLVRAVAGVGEYGPPRGGIKPIIR